MKIDQLSPYRGDVFLIRVSQESTFPDFANLVNRHYRDFSRSNTQFRKVDGNGDGISFLIETTMGTPLLELTLAGAQESRFLYIERKTCPEQTFREFYMHFENQLPTPTDWVI